MARVMRAIVQAVDDDILTDEEADAVIRFVGESFARRRFDEVLSRITSPRSGAWFVMHGQAREE